MNIGLRILAALGLSTAAASAYAHSGAHHVFGVGAGFFHPLTGWDHLLAALGVSLWAVQRGGRALWAAPAVFVCALVIAALGTQIGFSVPFVENGIALSVTAIGLLLLAATHVPFVAGIAAIGVFALWHGHAHGAEMDASAQAASYIAGLALGTALIHVAGLWLGRTLQKRGAMWLRGAGIGLAASSCLMLAGI